VQGPRNLLTALQRQEQAPRRIVFTSSTGVYAQRSGEWIDEDSPTEPSTDSVRALLIGERVFGASGFPTTVVRFGGIYGPGRARLIDEVAAGVARCPPGEPRWSNRIHLDDCSGVLDHLMQIAKPADLYVGVDREPAPFCEVIRWIAKRLGAAEPPIGEPPAAALTARSWRLTNKRCSSARLAASGYRFVHATYREGFASLIAGSSSRSGERSPS
jgi:nucleoside-diphosphate-sugar epimerase